jgi:hypothetical protein
MVVTSVQLAILRPETGGFYETLEAILNGDVDAVSALTEHQLE